ncbi:hydrogenase small subunit [Acidiferrobacter sp.]|uniref:hydrogenase small subunit n=1 Tax=Acidiferrobacter sp. TaxID=1872107 RepID=UPI0026094CE3|nr:hydrogenase small subunit [Acidiferrobacter sp.]
MTDETIRDVLTRRGLSRRAFLQVCASVTAALALSPAEAADMTKRLETAERPTVIYLSYQECTGCLESLTRSFSPGIASLIFNDISLAYNDTLQAAAGQAAETAKDTAMKNAWGKYVLVVDGSVPLAQNGAYCAVAGRSAVSDLKRAAGGAAAVVAVGTCAAFGGLPYAAPNPTGAVPVSEIVRDRPVINISGCPPIAEVITGVILYYTTFGVPALDHLHRPMNFYGNTIHDRCYRRPFYDRGMFAKTFDDEGARQGWCLFELGCKGPITHNACPTTKWNGGTSYPIESGHPCLGCSEPGFWDKGGFYKALSTPTGHWSRTGVVSGAVAAGVAAGLSTAAVARARQGRAQKKAASADSEPKNPTS